jgi:dTDP-4-dehydrorhamnose reductase
MTAAGETTWYEFAKAVIDGGVRHGLLDSTRLPEVEGIPTSQYPTPAARPRFSRLDNTKLTRRFGIAMPDWSVGLARSLEELAARA